MNLTKPLILLSLLSPLTQTMSLSRRKSYVLRPPNQHTLYTFSAIQKKDPNTYKITYQNPKFLKVERYNRIPNNLANQCTEDNVFPLITSFNQLPYPKHNMALFHEGTYKTMRRQKNNYRRYEDITCLKCTRHLYKDEDLFCFYENYTYQFLCLVCSSDEMLATKPSPIVKKIVEHWARSNNFFPQELKKIICDYAQSIPILPHKDELKVEEYIYRAMKKSEIIVVTVSSILAIGTLIAIIRSANKRKDKKGLNEPSENEQVLEEPSLDRSQEEQVIEATS